MKKATLLLLLFICHPPLSKAQFYKKILPPGTFSDSIAVIVRDLKKNFYSIEGNQLPSRGEMDVYRSKATVPGALHCAIYRFHSTEDTAASWQAIMYEGESYEHALKIYKNTFHLLKNSKMQWVDKSNISFVGHLEMPDENIRFAVTSLKLNVPGQEYSNFFGEVELTNNYDGWEVHLNLHSRKNDADEY